jgi:hypothetical protein
MPLPGAGCSRWEAHGLAGWGIVITILGLLLGAAALAMGHRSGSTCSAR